MAEAKKLYNETHRRANSEMKNSLTHVMPYESYEKIVIGMTNSGIVKGTEYLNEDFRSPTADLLKNFLEANGRMNKRLQQVIGRSCEWLRHTWGNLGKAGSVFVSYICPHCSFMPDVELNWWVVMQTRFGKFLCAKCHSPWADIEGCYCIMVQLDDGVDSLMAYPIKHPPGKIINMIHGFVAIQAFKKFDWKTDLKGVYFGKKKNSESLQRPHRQRQRSRRNRDERTKKGASKLHLRTTRSR